MFEGEPTYGTAIFAYFALFGIGKTNIADHDTSQLTGIGNRYVRIYSFKLWDADKNLLCNYVPCLQDDVACFYDRVTGTFVGSAGSVPLIPGPVRTR